MPNVWVVNPRTGMKFDAAEKYGELKTIFDKTVNPFDLKTAYETCAVEMVNGSEDDWILPCGNQAVNLMAALAFYYLHGRVNILVFHAQKHEYVPQEISL